VRKVVNTSNKEFLKIYKTLWAERKRTGADFNVLERARIEYEHKQKQYKPQETPLPQQSEIDMLFDKLRDPTLTPFERMEIKQRLRDEGYDPNANPRLIDLW